MKEVNRLSFFQNKQLDHLQFQMLPFVNNSVKHNIHITYSNYWLRFASLLYERIFGCADLHCTWLHVSKTSQVMRSLLLFTEIKEKERDRETRQRSRETIYNNNHSIEAHTIHS